MLYVIFHEINQIHYNSICIVLNIFYSRNEQNLWLESVVELQFITMDFYPLDNFVLIL